MELGYFWLAIAPFAVIFLGGIFYLIFIDVNSDSESL